MWKKPFAQCYARRVSVGKLVGKDEKLSPVSTAGYGRTPPFFCYPQKRLSYTQFIPERLSTSMRLDCLVA